MKLQRHLIAAAAALFALQAQAYTASLTEGPASPEAGITTETFQGAAVFSRSGSGAVFNSDSIGASLTGDNIWLVPNISAQPSKGAVSSNDKWFSLGSGESATFSFKAGTNYVGFLWGSVDSYNTVSYYDASMTLLASFKGGEGGLAANQVASGYGSQDVAKYFNFRAPDIAYATFQSSNHAFEIDNLSAGTLSDRTVLTAVPEPQTYLLMLAGLGVVGFLARRRRAD